MNIEANYTAYNTDDLELLMERIRAEKVKVITRDWTGGTWVEAWTDVSPRLPGFGPESSCSIHPLSGKRPGATSWRNWITENDSCHVIGGDPAKLLIRGKKALLSGQWGQYDRSDFSPNPDSPHGVVSDSLLADITRCLILTALGHTYRHSLARDRAGTLASVERSVQNIITGHQLRLLGSPPDKNQRKKGKKSTQSEKVQRFYRLYGKTTEANRKLVGGGRTATYQWEDRISTAEMHYHREWLRREAHRKKLLALGEKPVPYETFGDYLRGVAARWDNKNALLVLSQSDFGEED